MTAVLTRKAVLCDDDALLRSVISQMMTEVGYEVAGEAENTEFGLDTIERTMPDLVVLDLALRSGHGEHLLATLRQRFPEISVVVFSAYVTDPMRLLDAGAAAVVEKPDFTRLEEVLRSLMEGTTYGLDKRRPMPRELPDMPAPAGITLGGLESWRSFREAVDRLVPGDAVIAFDVRPTPGLLNVWDDVYRIDYRLTLARSVAATRRSQDRVSLSPDGHPVMLVVAGHPEAPMVVFDRLQGHWEREVGAAMPVAAFGHIGRDHRPASTLVRLLERIREDFTPEHPLHML